MCGSTNSHAPSRAGSRGAQRRRHRGWLANALGLGGGRQALGPRRTRWATHDAGSTALRAASRTARRRSSWLAASARHAAACAWLPPRLVLGGMTVDVLKAKLGVLGHV